MQSIIIATSPQVEPIVTTIKKPKPIKGGVELAIVFPTLLLPTKLVEVHVVSSIQVEVLEEPITPKPIPLTLPKIGVGTKVTLIYSVIHASKVFRTLDTILKETHVMERLDLQLIPLSEPINTIGEQLIDDLATRVKQVVLGD
jgi:hypothetical protein